MFPNVSQFCIYVQEVGFVFVRGLGVGVRELGSERGANFGLFPDESFLLKTDQFKRGNLLRSRQLLRDLEEEMPEEELVLLAPDWKSADVLFESAVQ